jgi:hypothetical protein
MGCSGTVTRRRAHARLEAVTRPSVSIFVLPTSQPETPVGQANWRGCVDCRILFYNGYDDNGPCPAGGTHSPGTTDHLLNHDIPGTDPAQPDWRFCSKCHGLYFDGYPEKGLCPAGGGHAAAGWNFVLPHAPEPGHGID